MTVTSRSRGCLGPGAATVDGARGPIFAQALTAELRDRLLAHLASRPDGDRVCHGDFHPENLLITARGPVVIDWMTATSGSPAADVARTTLLLSMAAPLPATPAALRGLIAAGRRAFHASYLRRYLRLSPVGWEQIDAWMPIVAATRLAEHIEEERDALLRLVRRSTIGGDTSRSCSV